MTLTTADADKFPSDDFAPRVLELGLSVEESGDRLAGCDSLGPIGSHSHGRAAPCPARP